MKQQKQHQKLGALIGELERELSENKGQVAALEETYERLRETERICQELAEENRRLGEEIAGWKERFATSEENQRQLSLLREQLHALQVENARVIETNRQMPETFTAGVETGNFAPAVENDPAAALMVQSNINGFAGSESDVSGSREADAHLLDSGDREEKIDSAKETKASQRVWASIVRNWHFGAVGAGVVLLVIAGAVAMNILRTEVPISADPLVLAPEATTVEHAAEPVSKLTTKLATKPRPRVRGAFQSVRPTQVFSGPSENSALIANIDKGIRLNVVDSRDGWLEIRSKHGRPPGFIRQDAAVRIGSN